MKNTSLVLAFALCFSGAVYAQEQQSTEGQTKMKVEDATNSKNAVKGDIDEELTNAKLRAESGSKSKFSISSTVNYSGGSINRFFAAKRPALSSDPGTQTLSSLSLGPEIRYRWSKNDSITAGNGFAVMTPLQGNANFKKNGQRINQVNFFDPAVNYNRAGKLGPLQTNGSIGLSVATSNESRQIDNSISPGVSYTLLNVFQNGLTVGTSVGVGYNLYTSKPGGNTFAASDDYGGDGRNTYSLGIYPFIEYAFNDTFSFRTLFGYFNWVHRYGDPNNWRLLQDYVYQSAGIGISVTRDIYLYPNLQFSPNASNQLAHDRTNVAISATINVF